VAGRVADHRATASEAMRVGMDRDVIEDLTQDPPLDLLEREE
jgi:hypothetical protein